MWHSICFKEQSVHVICFLAHCQFTFLKQITGPTVLEGRTEGARGRKETFGIRDRNKKVWVLNPSSVPGQKATEHLRCRPTSPRMADLGHRRLAKCIRLISDVLLPPDLYYLPSQLSGVLPSAPSPFHTYALGYLSQLAGYHPHKENSIIGI